MFPKTTKFIVIDDHSTMRKILKKILNDLGYTNIDEAEDGHPALAKIKAAFAANDPYGCIISDWNMPGMQGIDLLKAVRKDPTAIKATPFLLATAEGEAANVLEAIKAGVSDYVVKPFTQATVTEKLFKIYNKHFKKAL